MRASKTTRGRTVPAGTPVSQVPNSSPTPEEIAARAAEIRKEWTPGVRASRNVFASGESMQYDRIYRRIHDTRCGRGVD
jgi:hypothetical protein